MDYSIPPWLQQSGNFSESLARGTAIGSSFVANRLRAQENAREDALFPLRQQAMEAQMKSTALDLSIAQDKRNDQLLNKTAFAELAKASAEISAEGAWNKPEAESRIWGIGTRWPSVMPTPEFRNITSQFDKAAAADRMRALADSTIKNRESTIALQGQQLIDKQSQFDRSLTSREKMASGHDQTMKEIAIMRVEAQKLDKAHDILPQAQYAKYRELIRKMAKDETISLPELERKSDEALVRLRESLEQDRQNKAAPAPTGTQEKMIRVKRPDGTTGRVPASKLQSLPTGWEILDEG